MGFNPIKGAMSPLLYTWDELPYRDLWSGEPGTPGLQNAHPSAQLISSLSYAELVQRGAPRLLQGLLWVSPCRW